MPKKEEKNYCIKKIRNLSWFDISLIKLSVASFVLFVVSFLTDYIKFVRNWRWTWFALFILFAIKPFLAAFKCSEKKPVKVKGKKGAIELSVGTIVIIVIAITMLILGIVFVRSVMCGAIGLTSDLNDRVKGEINDLFGATGGEVQCIGSTGEPVRMQPGKLGIVYCGFKAPQTAKYSALVTDYSAVYSTKSDIKSWLQDDSWQGTISPVDDLPKKVATFNIPKEAPEDTIKIQVTIKKEGSVISTQDLHFQISRAGIFRAAMC